METKKYYKCEIERLEVTYSDLGRVTATIKKVNPPGPDVARIEILGYYMHGYKDYHGWDVRGVLKMIKEEVIKKSALANLKV